MKRIALCIVISILLVAVVLGGNYYVRKTLSRMETDLNAALVYSAAQEYNKAAGIYQRLCETFQENERKLSVFVKHDLLCEVGNALCGLASYNNPDGQADLKSETCKALSRIRLARDFYFSAY